MQTAGKEYKLVPLVSEEFAKLFRALSYGALKKINEPLNFSSYAENANSNAEVAYTRNQPRAFLNKVVEGVYETLNTLEGKKNIVELLNEAINKIKKTEKQEKSNTHKKELYPLISFYEGCIFERSSKGKIKMTKGGESIDIEILPPYKFLNNAGKKAILEETELANRGLIKKENEKLKSKRLTELTEEQVEYILGRSKRDVEFSDFNDKHFCDELKKLFDQPSQFVGTDLNSYINNLRQSIKNIKIDQNKKEFINPLLHLHVVQIIKEKISNNELSEADLQKLLLSQYDNFKFFDVWSNNAATKGLLYDIWTQINGVKREAIDLRMEKKKSKDLAKKDLDDQIVTQENKSVKKLVTASSLIGFTNLTIEDKQKDADYPCLIVSVDKLKDKVVDATSQEVFNSLLKIPNLLLKLSDSLQEDDKLLGKQAQPLLKIFDKKPPISVETLVSIFSEAFNLNLDPILKNFPPEGKDSRNLFMASFINEITEDYFKSKASESSSTNTPTEFIKEIDLIEKTKSCLAIFLKDDEPKNEFKAVFYKDIEEEICKSWERNIDEQDIGKREVLCSRLIGKVPKECKSGFTALLSKVSYDNDIDQFLTLAKGIFTANFTAKNLVSVNDMEKTFKDWDNVVNSHKGTLVQILSGKLPKDCKDEFKRLLLAVPYDRNDISGFLNSAKRILSENFKDALIAQQQGMINNTKLDRSIKKSISLNLSKEEMRKNLKQNKMIGNPRYDNAYLEFLNHLLAASINHHLYAERIGGYFDRRSSFGFLTPTVADVGAGLRLSVGLVPSDKWLNAVIEGIKDFDKYVGVLIESLSSKNREEVIVEALPLHRELLDGFHGELERERGDDYGYLTGIGHFLMLSALENGESASSSYEGIDYKEKLAKMLDKLDIAMEIKRKGSSNEQEEFEDEKKAFENKLKYHNYLKSEDEDFNSLFKKVHRVYELAITNLEGEIEKEFKELEEEKKAKNEELSSIINENELVLQTSENSKDKNTDSNPKMLQIFENLEEKNAGSVPQMFGSLSQLMETFKDKVDKLDGIRSERKFLAKEDGSSDSEEEGRTVQKYFSSCGMSSLSIPMQAYHDATKGSNETISFKRERYCYFETTGLKGSQFIDVTDTKDELNIPKPADVIYMDANPCVNGEERPLAVETIFENYKDDKDVKVLVVDITSSTTKQLREIKTAWESNFKKEGSNHPYLVFASSGIKHQQLGIDYVPFGENKLFVFKETEETKEFREQLIKLTSGQSSNKANIVRHALAKACGQYEEDEAKKKNSKEKGYDSDSTPNPHNGNNKPPKDDDKKNGDKEKQPPTGNSSSSFSSDGSNDKSLPPSYNSASSVFSNTKNQDELEALKEKLRPMMDKIETLKGQVSQEFIITIQGKSLDGESLDKKVECINVLKFLYNELDKSLNSNDFEELKELEQYMDSILIGSIARAQESILDPNGSYVEEEEDLSLSYKFQLGSIASAQKSILDPSGSHDLSLSDRFDQLIEQQTRINAANNLQNSENNIHQHISTESPPTTKPSSPRPF